MDLGFWLGSPSLGRVFYIIWGGAISLAAAILSWHLYEKHFLKFKDVLAPKNERILQSRAVMATPKAV